MKLENGVKNRGYVRPLLSLQKKSGLFITEGLYILEVLMAMTLGPEFLYSEKQLCFLSERLISEDSKNTLDIYNDIAGVCWVAGTVATVGAAFLLGGCAPERKQKPQQVEDIDFDEL